MSLLQDVCKFHELDVGCPLDIVIHVISLLLLVAAFLLMSRAITRYTEQIPQYWTLIVTGIGLLSLYIFISFLSGGVISEIWMLLGDVYLMLGSAFIFGGMYKLWKIYAE